MNSKFLEIRDRATTIPVIATITYSDDENEQKYFDHAGFDEDTIILTILSPNTQSECNSYNWDNRRITTAHQYIEEHFYELNNFDVIDIEFILGESENKKKPEII